MKGDKHMELIIGGAYQGKLAYARSKFDLSDEDIFVCTTEGKIDFSKRCICGLEEYILACVKSGTEPESAFRADAIIICRDISCGIVPEDPVLRAWREATGRCLNRLSAEAAHVVRLFCGLPQVLK